MKSTNLQLIESMHDGLCATDLEGRILHANPRAMELLEIDNYITQNINFFYEIIHNPSLIERIRAGVASPKGARDLECYLKSLQGNSFPVILTANYISDYDGTAHGYLFLFKDMTDLKKVNDRLIQAQKMESIGQLASGIAHEFNNILSGILPNAELIKMTTDDASTKARADMIHKAAYRAANIVKQLLSFARVQEYDTLERLSLSEAVSETLGILDKLFGRDIRLENKIPIDLPALEVNATQLQQIIMNLAINARDALEGSGWIRFEAHVENVAQDRQDLKPGDYVVLKVSDNGCGMSEETISKIYDPFFTTKEPGKGTGLGLSTVYGIVQNMHGAIEVESTLHEGTTFFVYLPVAADKPIQKTSEQGGKSADTFHHVLIIDDDLVVREMAGDLLDFLGHKIVKAESGEEGVNLFRKTPDQFDLVLVDLIMPGMNGVEVMKRIRAIRPNVRVVITSGVGQKNAAREMLNKGADGYLQKPYSLDAFRNIFRDILRNSEKNA